MVLLQAGNAALAASTAAMASFTDAEEHCHRVSEFEGDTTGKVVGDKTSLPSMSNGTVKLALCPLAPLEVIAASNFDSVA